MSTEAIGHRPPELLIREYRRQSRQRCCTFGRKTPPELSRLALRPEATPERQMSLFEAVDDFLYWEADV